MKNEDNCPVCYGRGGMLDFTIVCQACGGSGINKYRLTEVIMNKDKLIEKLKELQLGADKEEAHKQADNLLILYINDADIMNEFNKIDKYYI